VKGYLVRHQLVYDIKDVWCVAVSVPSLGTKGSFYNAIRVLLRLLKREIELEVVRKYIPREA
jgi:hypothetical protein